MNDITKEVEKAVDINKIEDTIENITDPFDTANRKPMWNFFGITDLSLIDYGVGFATGVYGRDVRQEYHECLGGPLNIFQSIFKLIIDFMSQDFTNLVAVFTNFNMITR